ncbi:MAG: hypothetical protein ACM3O3_11440 [Syntrophothermus sp.]
MKKRKTILSFLILTAFVLSLVTFSCTTNPKEGKNKIVIFPGVGISLNNDSIFINKTSTEELLQILQQKDTFSISKKHSELFDPKNGEESYIDEIIKHISYKGIDFEYKGKTKEKLSLENITIKANPDFLVFIHDSISLGQINPPIEKFYELKSESYDLISDNNLVYHFYSKGISFRLDSFSKSRKLVEVTIHFKHVGAW